MTPKFHSQLNVSKTFLLAAERSIATKILLNILISSSFSRVSIEPCKTILAIAVVKLTHSLTTAASNFRIAIATIVLLKIFQIRIHFAGAARNPNPSNRCGKSTLAIV
jgi:hypothetical protein